MSGKTITYSEITLVSKTLPATKDKKVTASLNNVDFFKMIQALDLNKVISVRMLK